MEVCLFGQFLNGVSPVAEDPLFAIQEGYGAFTGTRVLVSGVQGNQPRIGPECFDVYRQFVLGSLYNGKVIGFSPK